MEEMAGKIFEITRIQHSLLITLAPPPKKTLTQKKFIGKGLVNYNLCCYSRNYAEVPLKMFQGGAHDPSI